MNTSSASSSSGEPLSPAVFHVLLALALHERHGYGIMKQAEHDSDGRIHLGPGTLYGTIKRLIAAGLIEATEERPDPALDDQRRRYYRITPAGQQQLGLELERLDRLVTVARQQRLLPGHKVDALELTNA
ncbi:MAG TPA: helix-turn-helix transcriptional regulator [Candidatus Saccharimonadia bacterium]|nr:helix-turn-helix transcriptional regulator [Candidatus Saccharimonadia bacterium]